MDNETKKKYMDIVKTMQESLIPSPDVDIYLQHNDDQKWSGTEYNASGDELEHFVDNIQDFGIPAVANVGDTGEFGNGWVQITYLHEESSKKNEDDIKFRAYKLDFQCELCVFIRKVTWVTIILIVTKKIVIFMILKPVPEIPLMNLMVIFQK